MIKYLQSWLSSIRFIIWVVHVSNLIVLGKFRVSHISCWTVLGGLSSNGTAQHTALAMNSQFLTSPLLYLSIFNWLEIIYFLLQCQQAALDELFGNPIEVSINNTVYFKSVRKLAIIESSINLCLKNCICAQRRCSACAILKVQLEQTAVLESYNYLVIFIYMAGLWVSDMCEFYFNACFWLCFSV